MNVEPGLDRKLISFEEPHEVRNWCEVFGCTAADLEQAIEAVGNSADAVRHYLSL